MIPDKNVYELVKEMIDFVNKNQIDEFKDLVDYAIEKNPEWFESLCDDSSLIMSSYIDSKRRKQIKAM